MTRNTLLLLGGGLVSGLLLWQRGAETQFVVPATVVSVDQRTNTATPQTPWHITARADGLELAVEPHAERPEVSQGDAICVTVRRKPGLEDRYMLAPDRTSC